MKKNFILNITVGLLLGAYSLTSDSFAMEEQEKSSSSKLAIQLGQANVSSLEQLAQLSLEKGGAHASKIFACPEERSLVFLDNPAARDDISFLLRKYGAHPEVQAALRIRPSETYDYNLGNKLPQVQMKPGKNQSERCLNYLRSILMSSVYDPDTHLSFAVQTFTPQERQVPMSIMHGLYKDELMPILKRMTSTFASKFREQREAHRKPLMPVEEAILRLKEKDHQVFHDITYGAYMIDALRQQNGNASLLFLGRSGCFFQLACEELYKFRNVGPEAKDIFHLNFSGTPDIESKRSGGDLSDNSPEVLERHLVTPERLSFYCDYMDKQGMRSIGDKLYLVDIIGTGRSLNSALVLFRYYFEVYLKREKMPDVHFIPLCADLLLDSVNGSEVNFQDRKMSHWEYNSLKGIITFKETPEVGGIRPLQIKTSPVLIDTLTLAVIDCDFVEAVGVHGIEYPPHKWRPEFDPELTQGGKVHKQLYESIRPTMHLIFKAVDRKISKV